MKSDDVEKLIDSIALYHCTGGPGEWIKRYGYKFKDLNNITASDINNSFRRDRFIRKIKAKYDISIGIGNDKVIIPRGTTGILKDLSESNRIINIFPNLNYKPDGSFYVVKFELYKYEFLVHKDQVEILKQG